MGACKLSSARNGWEKSIPHFYFSTVDAWNECTTQPIYLLYNLSVEQRFRGKLNEISSRNNYGAHANFVWRAMGKRKKKAFHNVFFFSTGVWDGCPNPQPKYLFLIWLVVASQLRDKGGNSPRTSDRKVTILSRKNIYQYLICPKVFLKQYNIVKVIQVSCVRLKFQNAKPL